MATLRTQDTSKAASQNAEPFEHVPIVDYDAQSSAAIANDPQARVLKRDKDRRYSTGVKGLVKDKDTGGQPILTFSHWDSWLSAIPAAKSAVVVLGEVTDSQAHLSDDRTGVYSEFTVRIDEVLKGGNAATVYPGSLIVAERAGGRVRFASGRILEYGTVGLDVPRVGRSYVFFLEMPGDQQYIILMAYELRSGRVFPLDGESAPRGRRWAGDAYQGMDATQFVNEVQKAIVQSSTSASGKGTQ